MCATNGAREFLKKSGPGIVPVVVVKHGVCTFVLRSCLFEQCLGIEMALMHD